MGLNRLLRACGAATASVALIAALGAASLPSSDLIRADNVLATRPANPHATASSGAQLPQTPPPTQAEMRTARADLAARKAADAAEAAQLALAKAKAKAKASTKSKAKKQAKKDEAEITNTGPIPTAATKKSGEIQRLIRRHFPDDQLGNAMAVAACESGHSDAIGATNNDGTTDWGAFQLNDGGTLQSSLLAIGVSYESKEEAQELALNTEINVRAAAKIWGARGWTPWVCAYKIGIVATLYGEEKGPMYGKFDERGMPTVDVPTVSVGPGQAKQKDPVRPKSTKKPKSSPKPTISQPSPKPSTPQATPSPKAPTVSPEPTTGTASPSPSKSASADPTVGAPGTQDQ